jgi:signal transduction histidine kinase
MNAQGPCVPDEGDVSRSAGQPGAGRRANRGHPIDEALGGEEALAGDDVFEQLAARLPVGIARVGDGILTWANDRFVEMAGRACRSELDGVKFADLVLDTGEGLPGAAGSRAVRCGLHRPDGEPRTVICRPLWRENGAEAGAWVVEDTSHVQHLEHELQRMGRELHRVNRGIESLRDQLRSDERDLEELLTMVSHELRTPVTIISGYNRLLLSEDVGALNDEQRRFLEESQQGCRRLDAFIGNLLEASRETMGGEVIEVAHQPVEPVIRAVLDLLRPLVEEKRLRVTVDIAPDVARACFDRMRVEQVLTNLLGNAIRYARPDGIVEIEAQLLERDPAHPSPRPFVEIAVADDGPGVAPEDRERIFKPYVQLRSEGRAGGLGLGLAICRRLVAAHGGSIHVTDRDHGGSRFAFTLPLTLEAAQVGV